MKLESRELKSKKKKVKLPYLDMGKTLVQLLRLDTLDSTIEFKHMFALSNKKQIMLSFPIIIKFNAIMRLNSIREPNVPNIKKLYLSFIFQIYPFH